MKSCGTCTLCCKLLAIEELEKPPNQWCLHCTPGVGCQIYGSHPQSCHDFACLWLQEEQLPEELKPEICKAVLGCTANGEDVVVYVDPKMPDVYHKNKALVTFLSGVLQKGIDVYVVIGDQRRLLPAKRAAMPEVTDLSSHFGTKGLSKLPIIPNK